MSNAVNAYRRTVHHYLYHFADLLTYAFVQTVFVFLGAVVVGFASGGRWLVVEVLLFLSGWLIFAYGTLKLRGSPPWSVEETETGTVRVTQTHRTGTPGGVDEPTRFQRFVQRIPPACWSPSNHNEGFSVGAKVFATGVFVLATSFLVERLLLL